MQAWAIQGRSNNQLDGKREYLVGDYPNPVPAKLFRTRYEARQHIADKYGYIAKRPDLRAEPHGWRMPRAVKVNVTVEMVAA